MKLWGQAINFRRYPHHEATHKNYHITLKPLSIAERGTSEAVMERGLGRGKPFSHINIIHLFAFSRLQCDRLI